MQLSRQLRKEMQQPLVQILTFHKPTQVFSRDDSNQLFKT